VTQTKFKPNAITKLIACIIFSAAIVYTPWNSITDVDKFPDIDNYVTNISLISSTLDSDSASFFAFLFSEPAWQIILVIIFLSNVEPYSALKLISTFCALCISIYVVRRTKNSVTLLLLWNPLIIDLIISQIRSALALSICLIAIQCQEKNKRALLASIAALIHSATIVGIIFYFVAKVVENKQPSIKNTVAAMITLLVATALSIGRTDILTLLGDRRVEYTIETGSLLYVAFWFLFAAVLMSASGKIHPEKKEESFLASCLMSLPTLTNLMETNGTRFLAIGFPILIVAISGLSKGMRACFYFAIVPYQAIQFLYWLKN
jgi:hypothetical protein